MPQQRGRTEQTGTREAGRPARRGLPCCLGQEVVCQARRARRGLRVPQKTKALARPRIHRVQAEALGGTEHDRLMLDRGCVQGGDEKRAPLGQG